MKLYKVYLGRNMPGGWHVHESEIDWFLSEVVSPRIQGFTAIRGGGYWKGDSEQSLILEFIESDADLCFEVRNIAEYYKHEFSQESVLVTMQELEEVYLV